MGVRNSEELGINLQKVALRLVSNQNLCKYLHYTNNTPLENPDFEQPIKEILHKNIKVVPLVNVDENTTESTIVVLFQKAPIDTNNSDFRDLTLVVLVYVPLREWQLNDVNLRPYLIISEIEKSLKNKKVEGLGRLTYKGWESKLVTDNISCFHLVFSIDAFN